ncbi:hypothetical protein CPC08DRAFT_768686 [Agrocybe pediades]|nr:hypothetical protein CPC08DRAFT_768686 [Agrocybe pediades]
MSDSPMIFTKEWINSNDYLEFSNLFSKPTPKPTPQTPESSEPRDLPVVNLSSQTSTPYKTSEQVKPISPEILAILVPTLSTFVPDSPERPESPIIFAPPECPNTPIPLNRVMQSRPLTTIMEENTHTSAFCLCETQTSLFNLEDVDLTKIQIIMSNPEELTPSHNWPTTPKISFLELESQSSSSSSNIFVRLFKTIAGWIGLL